MHILLVDADDSGRSDLVRALESAGGVQVDAVASGPAALDRLAAVRYDAVVAALAMRPMDGIELVRRIRRRDAAQPVVLLTRDSDADGATEAMRAGATCCVPVPVDLAALLDALRAPPQAAPPVQPSDPPAVEHHGSGAANLILGQHPLLDAVRSFAERVARVPDARVLITGESGTGKSYLARAIHVLSGSPGRFVEVSCATLPPALMESELFGHERGAFTDARALKRGLVELASGGTLFLDEIGTLPLDMQTKLLLFLESRHIRRVGGMDPIASSARVIAATNEDLRAAAAVGRFRADLLYRIDVASIRMPALREMPGVTMELAHRFAADVAAQFRTPLPTISATSARHMQAYSWPGNARELRNFIERAFIFHDGGELQVEVPINTVASVTAPLDAPVFPGVLLPRGLTLEEVERIYLLDALARCDTDFTRLAHQLGISRKTLWDKRRRYGQMPVYPPASGAPDSDPPDSPAPDSAAPPAG
jgi:two-component system, NtrC family, response regulator AtoC